MLWPSALQIGRQVGHQLERLFEGLEFGDLAADMHVDTGDVDSGQRRGAGIDVDAHAR